MILAGQVGVRFEGHSIARGHIIYSESRCLWNTACVTLSLSTQTPVGQKRSSFYDSLVTIVVLGVNIVDNHILCI